MTDATPPIVIEPTELEIARAKIDELNTKLANQDSEEVIKTMTKDLKSKTKKLDEANKTIETAAKEVILKSLAESNYNRDAYEHLNLADLKVTAGKLIDKKKSKGIDINVETEDEDEEEPLGPMVYNINTGKNEPVYK